MFNTARKKLTAWYLIILMSVSLAFSIAIYRGMSMEVDRFAHLQRIRFERRFYELGITPPSLIDDEITHEMKQHIIVVLFGINGGIFIVMGALSYFLAGKTLSPIQKMMEEQEHFVSDASHELKTPLTAMKSALEVYLRDPKLTLAEAKQVLYENIEEVNRLSTLSENLLTLSENTTNDVQAAFSQVDMKALIERVANQMSSIANRKKIVLKQLIVSEIKIIGDEEKLRELFVILLDNAIKYSYEKSEITLSIEQKMKGAEIQVIDTGIGISSRDLPRVFDRFYRSDSARSRAGSGGYGLGLAIAKKIVALHHGTITIESAVKKGTIVRVWLPM